MVNENDEKIWLLKKSNSFFKWYSKIPKPMFAIGKYDLYSIMMKGDEFNLPFEESDLIATGFYTTRIVAAKNIKSAKETASRSVMSEWEAEGYLQLCGDMPNINYEKVNLLTSFICLHQGKGFSFYCNDDN